MTNPTLFMTISTGWAVRNFIYTGLLKRLSFSFRVVVICDHEFHAAVTKAVQHLNVEIILFDAKREPLSWRLMRQLRKKIYLDSRKSRTEEIWETYGKRPLRKRISGAFIKTIAKLFGPQRLQRYAVRLDLALNKTSGADHILKTAPSEAYFFATHASSYFEESLFRAAKKYCKRTALMILSWDHLSSKIILGPGYDDLFVWNQVSKDEILGTMDFYEGNQIHIVGAPQFDVYSEPSPLEYSVWCNIYNLDPNKRTILFSTIPQVRNDGQHQVLEKMAIEFCARPETFGNVQILVKVHPLDNPAVYEALCRYDFIKFTKKSGNYAAVDEDYALATNRDALTHATLNINTFSTMTLEAAVLDCPIVHLAFDLDGQTNSIPTDKYYEFEHFQPITASGCAAMSRSFEEFMGNIELVLNGEESRTAARKAVADLYFSETIGRSKDLIVQKISTIISSSEAIR